ncbi:MAG TPA: hypothetical protein GXX72_08280 [Clostridiaceae bacterium]|nr:hypothetical protein [Clostridiaceae bacterium]
MKKKRRWKSKVKSCVVINPPRTQKEQEEYDNRLARALAEGLYRSLGPEKIDKLLETYKRKEEAS